MTMTAEKLYAPSDYFNFKTKPFDHQIEAFNYAMDNPNFLLGDEQGLGKTKQSIDIAVGYKQAHKLKYCLIVCGVAGSKKNWEKEVGLHSNEKAHMLGRRVGKRGTVWPGSSKDKMEDLEFMNQGQLDSYFIITNIETLRNKELAWMLGKLCEKGIIGMTIIDEIHKAKNPDSKQGVGIQKLQSRFRLALTGTPLMNNPIDLYNPMKWLGHVKGSHYSFKHTYQRMGGKSGEKVLGFKNLDHLRSKFEPLMLRRKKEDVLDLPPKMRSYEYVEMTPKQALIYNEIREDIIRNIEEIKAASNPLTRLLRLRQATAHTAILSNTIQESAKFNRMKEIIEENVANGRKTIIFSNWASIVKMANQVLSKYNPAIITGEVSDRDAEIEKFQTDDSCMVISGTIRAMGTAFTLTAATEVLFLDKPWTMADQEQCEDRAHRIGTTGTVHIRSLVCENTIDERIEEILEEKALVSKAVVEGDEDTIELLSIKTEELIDRLLW